MPPLKKAKIKMNKPYEKCLYTLRELDVKLAESAERFGEEQSPRASSACSTPKRHLDNASKSSSGYDDEEFHDDIGEKEKVENSKASANSVCGFDSFVKISYDGIDESVYSEKDDSDNWTVCTVSDLDTYGFFDKDAASTSSEESDDRFVSYYFLPHYPPSEEMKISKNKNFSIKSVRASNEVVGQYVNDLYLTEKNIYSILKTLIEIEDITCLSQYPPLSQKNVILNWSERLDFWIPILNVPNIEDIVVPFMDELVLIPKASSVIEEANPSKDVIDTLFPHLHEYESDVNLKRRVAIIFKIVKNEVHFRFSKDDSLPAKHLASLSTTKYDVVIRPRRFPVRYQHRALELLNENEEVRKYLFPQVNLLRDLKYEPELELTLFNKTISSNPEQLEAVRFIAEGPNPNAPYVIFGPPGTGKTTTIVEAILQLRLHKPGSRILVTAGSNSACDTIALRICQYLNSNCQSQNIHSTESVENQKPVIRIFSKTAAEKGLHLIEPELLANSNCDKGFHYYPSVGEIRRYGIIVATLCTVGKLITKDIGKRSFFSHIFIDEAGASTEPEALVGIMGIKTTECRIVLSGDHKQLGPILKSERVVQLGLSKSLMERLLTSDCYTSDENSNYDRTIQARLKRNYRSHPEIVRLFNHLYYNNELIADAKMDDVNMAANWCKLPNPNFPIIFQAVHGLTEKDTVTPSSRNNLEKQVLMWFLQRLLVDGIDGRRVDQSDIGIITPYRLQNNLIQKCLYSRGWHRVESGPVEAFQGREKQIIIVSLVRSFTGLGFVRNPKRLNVILSRPKALLILIGNPLTFKRHPDFDFIMEECRRHGTFLRKKKTKKLKLKKAVELRER